MFKCNLWFSNLLVRLSHTIKLMTSPVNLTCQGYHEKFKKWWELISSMWKLAGRLWVVWRNCSLHIHQISDFNLGVPNVIKEILLVLPWKISTRCGESENLLMGKEWISISIPWNLFELPPSSHLKIAKDKYDR